jgi:hypothetical protein
MFSHVTIGTNDLPRAIAFDAPDRAAVRAWHARGLALGARDEGTPGLRPHYHADFYGAYLRDQDG